MLLPFFIFFKKEFSWIFFESENGQNSVCSFVQKATGINCVENGSGSISGPGKPGCQAQNVSLFWAGPCGGLLSGYKGRYGIR